MGKTYIQLIKAAAARVRDSKLKKLDTKETGEALDALAGGLGMRSRSEAVIFAAIFDRYDFCKTVGTQLEDRDVSCENFFSRRSLWSGNTPG